jgi:hypothetical protein
MPTSNTASRRHQRNPYKEKMEICLHSRLRDESLIAVGSNISDSGACLYTFKPLRKGQGITFKSSLPVPCHGATVKWVKQYNQNIYKVGVSFTP